MKCLRSFPTLKLKIAQEPLIGVPDDRNDIAIVWAKMDLAKYMGRTIFAKGAETSAQVEFLRVLRCNQVQGCFFSRAPFATDFLQVPV